MMRLPRRFAGRRLVTTVAVVALAAGVGVAAVARAQGSEDTEPDGARPPDYYASSEAVCTLLSAADLRALLARRFAAGEDPGLTNTFADMPGLTKCRYPTAEKEGMPHVEIAVVYAYAGQIFEDVHKVRTKRTEAGGSSAIGSAARAIPGLGDRARWYPQAGELLVLAGDKIFAVAVPAELLETEHDVRERARRLAARALERL